MRTYTDFIYQGIKSFSITGTGSNTKSPFLYAARPYSARAHTTSTICPPPIANRYALFLLTSTTSCFSYITSSSHKIIYSCVYCMSLSCALATYTNGRGTGSISEKITFEVSLNREIVADHPTQAVMW